jgi:hypothetical protein
MSYADEVRIFIPVDFSSHANVVWCSQDLLAAIGHTRRGNQIANQHRKKAQFLGSRLAGYVASTLGAVGSGVEYIKSMTDVERHAELVYAESLFEKVRVTLPVFGG